MFIQHIDVTVIELPRRIASALVISANFSFPGQVKIFPYSDCLQPVPPTGGGGGATGAVCPGPPVYM